MIYNKNRNEQQQQRYDMQNENVLEMDRKAA